MCVNACQCASMCVNTDEMIRTLYQGTPTSVHVEKWVWQKGNQRKMLKWYEETDQ